MNKLGKSLIKGAKEALSYAKGKKKSAKSYQVKIPNKIDVGHIRDKLHMSQSVFAARFGFSLRTIEKWEQGIRQPAGAARAYLIVIDRNPEAVQTALMGDKSKSRHQKHTHPSDK